MIIVMMSKKVALKITQHHFLLRKRINFKAKQQYLKSNKINNLYQRKNINRIKSNNDSFSLQIYSRNLHNNNKNLIYKLNN